MLKKIFIIFLSWLTVLVSLTIIFLFSEENMEESSKTSSTVTEEILDIVLPKEEITPDKINKFQPTVRTMAHFGIFMLLGFCLANAFKSTFKINLILNYCFSFISSVIYAIFDEYHQKFTGRATELKDVLTDSVGGFIGILLFALFYLTFAKLKNKNPS